jgi:hypothetical protein
MTTPAVREDRAPVQGQVISPSAVANATQSAAFELGQVIKTLVAGSSHAFHSENEVLDAHRKIDTYVRAHVPVSARAALADGTQTAPVEDVSKRPAPAGAGYIMPSPNAPAIDYDRLAAAIVRAQLAEQAAAQESAAAPAPVQVTEPDSDE